MKDKQYTLMYPWQMEKIVPKGRYKPVKPRERYEEWDCAWPGCTAKVNNIETKSKKRKYCPVHNELSRNTKEYARLKKSYQEKKNK